jgi:hypothetical protein
MATLSFYISYSHNSEELHMTRGHAVVWRLRHYATSGNVAGSRPDKVNFFILPAALGSGVHSASNTNEYQKQKNSVSGE